MFGAGSGGTLHNNGHCEEEESWAEGARTEAEIRRNVSQWSQHWQRNAETTSIMISCLQKYFNNTSKTFEGKWTL